jgi:predicted site-specific integrase-resolvase
MPSLISDDANGTNGLDIVFAQRVSGSSRTSEVERQIQARLFWLRWLCGEKSKSVDRNVASRVCFARVGFGRFLRLLDFIEILVSELAAYVSYELTSLLCGYTQILMVVEVVNLLRGDAWTVMCVSE